MKIAVTGAAGFVGRAVIEAALRQGHHPIAVVRQGGKFPAGVEVRAVGDLLRPDAQAAAVEGCEAVIHLAARTRIAKGERRMAAELFTRDNAILTEALARAAAAGAVRRFVLASSVKVFPSTTASGETLTDASAAAPSTPYGVSKLAAEERLSAVAAETGLSAISLRLPAVYGPGASASQLKLLMRGVARGLPFPVLGVGNRRSFIYVGNLAEALLAAAVSEATGTFLVTDSDPISTEDLIRRIAAAMGARPRLVPAPFGLIRAAARAAGKGEMADSLLGSMAVDGSRFAKVAGWAPSHSLDEALRETVRALG